ncbi:uncharacterized protein LOC122715195 [Apis laboriosa]|uniref:uncharacterized protein LOC122715195 n=1 Tax=Apis laboriosa TaxID=183418 RepID=UPI0003DF4F53|nr:uncharacterized protein LOC102671219 isoform X1 [Apis dorsata]XP_043793109.1 uncharacterized protein LOC122715195 [Apis laboriosa]
MATLLTTRHWGSDESFNCFGKMFVSKFTKSQENRNNNILTPVSDYANADKSLKQSAKRNIASKITKLKTKTYNEIILESSHVKASALLYEITERTNQLAQPRQRIDEKQFQVRSNLSQIPKASPRIIELSKPRIPYQYPSKPVGYVAPSALTAVATQRIIELSKPKRKRRLKITKINHNKRKSKLHKEKSRSYGKRGKKKDYKNRDYKHNGFNRYKNDRKQKVKKKVKLSNSDRTIIMVGLNLKNDKKIRR